MPQAHDPVPVTPAPLPVAAPARVLACGAFLKNTACLLQGPGVWWSAVHDDLSSPEACTALEASLQALVQRADGPIQAVAHDLHPDFHSTRLARHWADRLGVPAIGVQHHHAHIAAVQAQQGMALASGPSLVGLALDGVGLGTDGQPWGGEVLAVCGAGWHRVGHLAPLALPGGDVAAREPWRLAAAVLHASGDHAAIGPRLGPLVGASAASLLATMLARGLNCPATTSAGRWFDAAAGALGLCVRQTFEAEAAMALERAATEWLEAHRADAARDGTGTDATTRPLAGSQAANAALDLLPLVRGLFDEPDRGRGAARFHLALADGLVLAARQAAAQHGAQQVVLAGGCFYNRLLTRQVDQGLRAAGLAVCHTDARGPGDAGLALGQAWAAALQIAAGGTAATATQQNGRACVPGAPFASTLTDRETRPCA